MKRICIANYLVTHNEFGDRRAVYVSSTWGNSIDFDGNRWRLRDKCGYVISVGNVAELHGCGSDDYEISLKNIVCY